MQAVILAAGEGRRLRPLTEDLPKPLIPVLGKPILTHILEALPEEIEEIFIIIGYKGDLIRSQFGDKFGSKQLHYIEQEKPTGTADALRLARNRLHGRFLLMNGDDIHGKESLCEAIRYPLAIIAATHDDPSKFGVVEVNSEGVLCGIEEKPEAPKSNLVSTGGMVLDERIFLHNPVMHETGEYYLPDQLAALALIAPIQVVVQNVWIPIGYPEDIQKAESYFNSAG